MNKTHVICRQVVSDRDSVQDEEPHCWVGRRRRALQTMPATSYPIHTDTPPSSQPSWWKIWHPNWQPNISRPCSNLHSTIAMLPLHWLMIGNGKLSFVLKPTFVKLLQSCNILTNSLTHEPTMANFHLTKCSKTACCALDCIISCGELMTALKAAISSPQGALWQTWQHLGNTKANEQPWWEWC